MALIYGVRRNVKTVTSFPEQDNYIKRVLVTLDSKVIKHKKVILSGDYFW